jgi:hypothetical protein
MPLLNEFAVVSLGILVFVLSSIEQGQLCPFLIQSISLTTLCPVFACVIALLKCLKQAAIMLRRGDAGMWRAFSDS